MTDQLSLEMIPISALNALEYCPRSFYYQVVQGEMLVNELVLEGQLAHQRIHQGRTYERAEGENETTRLYLYSEALHLSGFTDVMKEKADLLVPIEYKHGQQGQQLNDQIQLCAQALCLEEQQPEGPPITYGSLYSIGSRRQVKVPFTPALRARTRAAIAQAVQVATLATPPPPLAGKMAARCPHCNLLPLCLPDEVRRLQAKTRTR